MKIINSMINIIIKKIKSMRKISSFLEIIDLISDDTLVVLDIDDTIIKYKDATRTWWKSRYDHHSNLSNDQNVINLNVQLEWKNLIKISDPEFVDEVGLKQLYKKIKETRNTDLIYLTARDETIKQLTEQHFNFLDLEHISNINYTAGGNKGEHLENIIRQQYPDKNNYIFVDDFEHNIRHMKEACTYNVQCCKFINPE